MKSDKKSASDISAYVQGATPDRVLKALSVALGHFGGHECIASFQFYDSDGCTLVVGPAADGYLSYSLVGVCRWKSDVEFARFLAGTTGQRVRCDPGSTFPQVPIYSDAFLQIENGVESLINWSPASEG